jgi:hypothetical protein
VLRQLLKSHDLEYRKARTLLGDILSDVPALIFWRHDSPVRAIVVQVVGDLPMVRTLHSYLIVL